MDARKANMGRENTGAMNTKEGKEQLIVRMVEEKMPYVTVGIVEADKNNGYKRTGFQFCKKGSPSGIILYPESMEAACGEGYTAEEAADYLCSVAEKELQVVSGFEKIREWETVRCRVYKKVVNYERNSSRLPSLVHRRYLDLAEVCYFRVRIPGKDWGVAEVSVKMLEEWGITEEKLFEQANANMDAEEYRVRTMREVMREIILEEEFPQGGLSEGECPETDFQDGGVYLILNSRKEFGAGIMTRPGRMKEFMQQIGTDCYILPCSVHELLAYPCGQDAGAEELQKMVWEANREAVSPEEFLSDHVYFCHMDSGEVDLCQEGRTGVCSYGWEDAGWKPDIAGVMV